MITFAFDATGKCVCSVNKAVGADFFPDALYVVQMPVNTDVNSVWYDVENGRVGFKKPLQVTVSTNRVSGLPAGSKVAVDGELRNVESGSIEFEVDYPQLLKVVVFNLKHLDTVVEVPCEVQG